MQDPILSSAFTTKLYSQKAIMIGTLIGTPLTGAYLIAKNFKVLDHSSNTGRVWLSGIGAFIFIVVLSLVIPPQVPGFLFIFLNSWLGHFGAQQLQGAELKKHTEEGGLFYSAWRAAGIGLVVSVIFIGIALGAYFLIDTNVK